MAYDLLIKGGTVVDGIGSPGRRADVAVMGGRIADIGRIGDGAAETIDAAGIVVAPGSSVYQEGRATGATPGTVLRS